ncbi:hypothetical protein [Staphylococcus phage vB_SauM-V1SA19]|nr:hypothetical protein [Staphylococcus phage vB_SauM-V1SA19]
MGEEKSLPYNLGITNSLRPYRKIGLGNNQELRSSVLMLKIVKTYK